MNTTIDIMKALSDRNRLRVVAALMQQDELCACQITEMLGVTGATASRHMDLLIRASLVDSRKEGRWVHYKLSQAFPAPLLLWLQDTLLNATDIKTDRHHLKKIIRCSS
jgi:ArsR family transcriptional regulator